eukprot:1086864-Prorocentrum_minimum.AAC.8
MVCSLSRSSPAGKLRAGPPADPLRTPYGRPADPLWTPCRPPADPLRTPCGPSHLPGDGLVAPRLELKLLLLADAADELLEDADPQLNLAHVVLHLAHEIHLVHRPVARPVSPPRQPAFLRVSIALPSRMKYTSSAAPSAAPPPEVHRIRARFYPPCMPPSQLEQTSTRSP